MRRIVRSVEKAIAEDVPQYLREHHKETNNAIIQLRGDYINDNLRNMVVGENIELVPFKDIHGMEESLLIVLKKFLIQLLLSKRYMLYQKSIAINHIFSNLFYIWKIAVMKHL